MSSENETVVESGEAPVEGAGEVAAPAKIAEPDKPDDAKPPRWKMPDAYGWWGLGLFGASAAVTIAAYVMFPSDGMIYFRTGAAMGAGMGLLGAILRVLAHDDGEGKGNRKLDLLGKVVAIYAAFFAMMFAAALLGIQVYAPNVPL